MSKTATAPLARAHQRRWLAVLCGASGLAIVQQVGFPQQPPLPVPPDPQSMPIAWRSAEHSISASRLMATMLQRDVATGFSQRFSKGSESLLLTPLASWKSAALDPAKITSSMPELYLSRPKLLSLQEKPQQIAIGRIQGVITFQTCLTRKGLIAFSNRKLEGISDRSRQDFLRTLIKGRLPFSPKPSVSCLLITTNNPSVLNGSADSQRFLKDLAIQTQWPL
jgi:hypothetical protein